MCLGELDLSRQRMGKHVKEIFQELGTLTNLKEMIFQELCTLTNLKAVGITVEGVAGHELLSEAHFPVRALSLSNLEEASAFCLSGGPFSNGFMRRYLYFLEISESTMEQIILVRHEVWEPGYHFDALDQLRLLALQNLRVITWKGVSPKDLFPRLTGLHVDSCDQLEHVSLAMYLPFLERLQVSECKNMKQAFPSTENDGAKMYREQESSVTSIDTFPCLKNFRLFRMPQLVSICNSDVTFPSLEHLLILDCSNLKGLPFRMQSLPHKLKQLDTNSKLWERLEWEEEGVKSFLQPRLRR